MSQSGSGPARRRIGLVGCVKTKRPVVATAAKDLYDSPLFHGQRRAAEASCDRWYVPSAKHGLIDPDEEIEPYEETLHGTSRRLRPRPRRRRRHHLPTHRRTGMGQKLSYYGSGRRPAGAAAQGSEGHIVSASHTDADR